jgi:hypothetical protein
VLSIKHAITHSTKIMNLNTEWEKFEGGPIAATQDRMHITINDKGVIFLNGNAYKFFGRPPAVNLYYNRVKNVMRWNPQMRIWPKVFP